MTFEAILFYVFAAVLVGAALGVVMARNPVHAVMFLVLSFFTAACLWVLLEAEFLAITLVLVYVGAVMVLFLFVVMMLDINIAELREGFARYFPIAAVVAVVMMVALGSIVGHANFGLESVPAAASHGADYSNTYELGKALYTDFIWPFEIAAVVLLVAIIAAIALTLRPTRQTKAPRPEHQVAVRREDRIRIVKVEAEKDA